MWFWMFWVSIVVLGFLLFYIRWLLKTIESINDDIVPISLVIEDLVKHIESVYELEMFYGDDTLKSLIVHCREASAQLSELDLVLVEEEEEVEVKEEA